MKYILFQIIHIKFFKKYKKRCPGVLLLIVNMHSFTKKKKTEMNLNAQIAKTNIALNVELFFIKDKVAKNFNFQTNETKMILNSKNS